LLLIKSILEFGLCLFLLELLLILKFLLDALNLSIPNLLHSRFYVILDELFKLEETAVLDGESLLLMAMCLGERNSGVFLSLIILGVSLNRSSRLLLLELLEVIGSFVIVLDRFNGIQLRHYL